MLTTNSRTHVTHCSSVSHFVHKLPEHLLRVRPSLPYRPTNELLHLPLHVLTSHLSSDLFNAPFPISNINTLSQYSNLDPNTSDIISRISVYNRR